MRGSRSMEKSRVPRFTGLAETVKNQVRRQLAVFAISKSLPDDYKQQMGEVDVCDQLSSS